MKSDYIKNVQGYFGDEFFHQYFGLLTPEELQSRAERRLSELPTEGPLGVMSARERVTYDAQLRAGLRPGALRDSAGIDLPGVLGRAGTMPTGDLERMPFLVGGEQPVARFQKRLIDGFVDGVNYTTDEKAARLEEIALSVIKLSPANLVSDVGFNFFFGGLTGDERLVADNTRRGALDALAFRKVVTLTPFGYELTSTLSAEAAIYAASGIFGGFGESALTNPRLNQQVQNGFVEVPFENFAIGPGRAIIGGLIGGPDVPGGDVTPDPPPGLVIPPDPDPKGNRPRPGGIPDDLFKANPPDP